MQTLEHTQELQSGDDARGRRPRSAPLIAAVALVVVAAAVAYGVGASRSSNRTIVRTVTTPARPAAVATPVAIDDRGFSKLDNGHQAETNVFQQPLDAATRALLQHQLTLARQAAMQYPTVRDAEAAGWRRSGPFAPGLGAHYFNFGGGSGFAGIGVLDDAQVLHPISLIYDGTKPDSRIAGLMYYSATMRIPQGFAGSNDIWHYHTNVCIVNGPDGSIDTPFGADTAVTQAMCQSVHGGLLQKTQWMLHAWVVPGYDSPEGVFSHDNAAITCSDGTYHTIPLDKIGDRSTICVDGSE
jgi:hypothetical protein